MEPYIEVCGLWGDFHNHLIEKIAEKIADQAPERYLIRTGERSYVGMVESSGKTRHAFVPEVSIIRWPRSSSGSGNSEVDAPIPPRGHGNLRDVWVGAQTTQSP
jgi:hypothetical protein